MRVGFPLAFIISIYDKMQYLRKRVLDLGNDSLRNQSEDLEKFTVHFKFRNYYKD